MDTFVGNLELDLGITLCRKKIGVPSHIGYRRSKRNNWSCTLQEKRKIRQDIQRREDCFLYPIKERYQNVLYFSVNNSLFIGKK